MASRAVIRAHGFEVIRRAIRCFTSFDAGMSDGKNAPYPDFVTGLNPARTRPWIVFVSSVFPNGSMMARLIHRSGGEPHAQATTEGVESKDHDEQDDA